MQSIEIRSNEPENALLAQTATKVMQQQIKAHSDELEEVLFKTIFAAAAGWPPQNVRCPDCSDWKVGGKGAFFQKPQMNLRDDCKSCLGSGIMPIPLSEFDDPV